MVKKIGIIAALSTMALFVAAPSASAAIVSTINPANAPTGTHFQRGSALCTVGGVTVTCSTYQLAGVGNSDATASLSANWTATVDCFNPGANPQNPIESHTQSFSDTVTTGELSPKNGRLTVPSLTANPEEALDDALCPNPNWDPRIREGTLTLTNFTYTLTFEGFAGAFITITGP